MKRCPECGRGGGRGTRLTAPALLTLAAGEVAAGIDMEAETLAQLVLLRQELRAAERTVDAFIDRHAAALVERTKRTLAEQGRPVDLVLDTTPEDVDWLHGGRSGA